MNNKTFTNEQITAAIRAFKETYLEVISTRTESDKTEIGLYSQKQTLKTAAYLYRPDSLNLINDEIFLSSVIRDFILDLNFRYFSLHSTDDSFIEKLCKHLTCGLMLSGEMHKTICTIPKKIGDSLDYNNTPYLFETRSNTQQSFNSEEASIQYLINNKHVVLMLLIQLTYAV